MLCWLEMSSTPLSLAESPFFGVGQRRSRQPQLVGKVHLTAKAHLYAVLIGKLNITQVAYVQRGRAVKQSV